mgnify:FL=1
MQIEKRLRDKNIEARRQLILKAAGLLLSRGGLKALSMRKLAEESSLSVNTLYNLWGNREDILRALTVDARKQLEASLPKDLSQDDPFEFCRAAMQAQIREICRQHELFRPMMLAWLEGEIEGITSPIEPMANTIKNLASILKAARHSGLFETKLSLTALAGQIHHSVQFASIQWALGRINDDEFEARALYGLHLVFLSLVGEARREEITRKIKRLERKLKRLPV